MNPAGKFMIFFGLFDLFYGYPLDFGPIIHPQFFSPIYGIFWQCVYIAFTNPDTLKKSYLFQEAKESSGFTNSAKFNTKCLNFNK